MKNKANIPQTFLAGQSPKQNFRGFAQPSDDFRAVQNNTRSPVHWIDFDLTNARSIAAGTEVVVEFAGNSFYVDAAANVGEATVRFQNIDLTAPGAPIFIQKQFIARVPFVRFLLENTAQPGQIMRIFYGVDIDFVPGSNSQVTLAAGAEVEIKDSNGNTINSVNGALALTDRRLVMQDGGYTPGVFYQSATNLVANTPQNIIAAASNLNGYVAHRLQAELLAAAATMGSFLANAAAPASRVDGDILTSFHFSTVANPNVQPAEHVRVASGKRLDVIGTTASTQTTISAKYTLF